MGVGVSVCVCVSFLRSCLRVCVRVWAVVYKLKCLNICISFCLRLACSLSHILPSHSPGGVAVRGKLQSFCGYDIGFRGRLLQARERERGRERGRKVEQGGGQCLSESVWFLSCGLAT